MNNFFNKYDINIWLSPILLTIITVILLIINIYLGIVSLIFTIFSMFSAYDMYLKRNDQFKKFVDTLDLSFEGFTKTAIFSMPFPIAVLNDNYELVWYNQRFKQMVGEKESLVDLKIRNIIPVIEIEHLDIQDIESFNIDYSLKQFEVHKNTTITSDKRKMTLLYFIDITEREKIYNDYLNEKMVMFNIRQDNYEEITQATPSEKRPILFAEIDSIITTYFHKHGGFIKKSDSSRYIGALQKNELDEMIKDKFSFIEDVRNVNSSITLPPTLSIGIGYNEDSPRKNEKASSAALDIALGRGGDQVVIKNNDKLDYFGGKNRATEKRTKVKARVVAHALNQYIQKASEIFISGHQNPDMDSFGSSVGLWYTAIKMDKKAYIILSKVNSAIENLYNYAIKNIEGLEESIISPEEAYNLANASSLLLVTDNHRKNSIEEPRLFEKTSSVVVIDHHRRGNNYIDNAILNYEEPSASSASELVTEMLMYMNEKVEINKYVADALLAGIMTDTQNFNKQTGVRTFESAVVLREHGAETTTVSSLFAEDFMTIKTKAEIISNAEIYKNEYAIGILEEEMENSSLIASLSADELAQIRNMEASFVIVYSNGKVHISARSFGEVSVQLIMEKLHGGGHRNMAATQLETSIEEAKKLLKKAIDEYQED